MPEEPSLASTHLPRNDRIAQGASNLLRVAACLKIRWPGAGNAVAVPPGTTGEVVWETGFPAGTTGAPMTYLYKGKQYIVVAIGSANHAAEFVALALP